MTRLTSFIVVIGATLFCVAGVAAQVVAPRALSIPDPEYPPEALQAHRGGEVFVMVWVSKKGKVSLGEAYGPMAPCSKLDDPIPKSIRQAAINAAATATFEPGTKDGKPADMGIRLKYVFDPYKKPVMPEQKPPQKPVQGGVLNGHAIKLVRPIHPGNRFGSAFVTIEVLIDETGKIIEATALSAESPFTKAAVDAACRSLFSPTTLSGQPVKVTGSITYTFAP